MRRYYTPELCYSLVSCDHLMMATLALMALSGQLNGAILNRDSQPQDSCSPVSSTGSARNSHAAGEVNLAVCCGTLAKWNQPEISTV